MNLDVLEAVHERMYTELTSAEGDPAATPSPTDQRQNNPPDAGNATASAEESLGNRYFIARDQSNGIYLPTFLKDPKIAADPAFKVRANLSLRKVDTTSNHDVTTGFHKQIITPLACPTSQPSHRQ